MTTSRYQDATESVEERVDDLLARMTLEEKVGQLTGVLSFDLLGAAGLDEKLFEVRRRARVSIGTRVSPPRRRPPVRYSGHCSTRSSRPAYRSS
jgi:hypothetical protein